MDKEYICVSQMLKASFEKNKGLLFFKNTTYAEYFSLIEDNYKQWEKFNISENDIVVVMDKGSKNNLLDILTALYHGCRICMIHNKLFKEGTLEKLSILGDVRYVNQGSVIAVLGRYADIETRIIASTSGTTGVPNLVQHNDANIIENIAAIEEYLYLIQGDTIYLQRNPIYLSVLVGEVLLGIERGCCFFVPENASNPKQLIVDIRENKIALIVSVMSYFDTLLPMLRKNVQALQSLKYLQFVGEGGRAGLIDDLASILPHTDVIIGYGLTEVGPRVSYMSCRQMTPEQYLVGRLLRNVEARVLDDNGVVLDCGQKGTVEIKSPSVMLGYVGRDKVKEWFRTSDYGWLDEEGRLYIQGRLDDIVIRNGVKVPLISIEQAMMKSDMLTGVMAFTTKHHTSGVIRVEVAVTIESNSDNFCDELMKWCRVNLDECLWPQKIYILDEFVFKNNGKLDKAAIKARALGEI